MLSIKQLKAMLVLQNAMNVKVNANWLELNRNWYLAAGMEGAEAIGHHGWKWWKHQQPDLPQLRMELVDIWHFILSQYLVDNSDKSFGAIAKKIRKDSVNDSMRVEPLLQNMQEFTGDCFHRMFNLELFTLICEQSSLSTNDLFKTYIGKNVLNIFRQDNGYKEGIYQKIWYGEEDNVHLENILKLSDVNSETFVDDIRTSLQRFYPG